jgi:hypothetical protein
MDYETNLEVSRLWNFFSQQTEADLEMGQPEQATNVNSDAERGLCDQQIYRKAPTHWWQKV